MEILSWRLSQKILTQAETTHTPVLLVPELWNGKVGPLMSKKMCGSNQIITGGFKYDKERT